MPTGFESNGVCYENGHDALFAAYAVRSLKPDYEFTDPVTGLVTKTLIVYDSGVDLYYKYKMISGVAQPVQYLPSSGTNFPRCIPPSESFQNGAVSGTAIVTVLLLAWGVSQAIRLLK